MAQVDNLKRDGSMTDLEKSTLHAVRTLLKNMNVYHAVWDIVIHQISPNTLEITAWIPMNITLPGKIERPVNPINFYHTGEVMREFTDVSFQPIARELAKEMVKAFQLGPRY